MEVAHLTPASPRYIDFIGDLGAWPLAADWYADAESTAREYPDASYFVTYAPNRYGAPVPAAWAGYLVLERDGRPFLKCVNNYVTRPFRGRDPDLWQLAYRERHRRIVTQLGAPAETYLFPEPIPVHLADGWQLDTSPTGSGVSRATGVEHHWQRLTWAAR